MPVFSFYGDQDFKPRWEKFLKICEREETSDAKSSASKHIRDFVEEYVMLHEPGNPQQRFDVLAKLGKAYRANACLDCGAKPTHEVTINGVKAFACRTHFIKRRSSLNGWKEL